MPRRGEGKIHKNKIIENRGFKNKARAGGGGQIIQSMACQDEAGGKIFDKKTIIESIESMGCQERGWKNLIKRKPLKAWVAKKGGWEKLSQTKSLKAWVAKKGRGWRRKSLKAWVAKKGGGKIFEKKKIIESMGCQEGEENF